MQISSSPQLKPFVRHYLFMDLGTNDTEKLRLFPDASCGLVFLLKRTGAQLAGHTDHLPDSFVYGQPGRYIDLTFKQDLSFVAVVFQPWGLHHMLGFPATEISGQILPAAAIFGTAADRLADRLAGCQTQPVRVRLLEEFLNAYVEKRRHNQSIIVPESIRLIRSSHGNVSVQQLAKHMGYTSRHIERSFNKEIGISPKSFAEVVKLHHFIALSRLQNPVHLTNMSYEAGYTDLSHLQKAFRRHTGTTPGRYLLNQHKLAVNLFSLKGW
ncbi:AraC family transcriptional regulator [Pedobacter yulinensis]|uniref:AraC family transcriptional regulator n=1 Tax=Pedobacter yulinensis TaxID=2126353 RepID=A0A2T3HJG8_9SPHI|nr:helix-turn-helix transcriptional regulator [Pedobacter yulinensis]PST82580.1 AraC family transcriptional regulator [Pedobacter yulinensis]